MTTEERLAKVERELVEAKAQAIRAKRRSRWLLAALGLGLGVLAFVWASAASVPRAEAQGAVGERMVRANMFILEDGNGKGRAILGMDEDGPMLSLRDVASKTSALLSVSPGGTLLLLTDANGKKRVSLGVTKDGPGLILFDAAGKEIWGTP